MSRIVPFTAIFTAFLCFNYAFGFYLFPMVLPEMRDALRLDYATVGTMTAVAQLAFVGASLLSGPVAARFGGGRLVVASAAACGLALLAIGTMPSVPLLASMLALLGAAAASVWIPMVALVAEHVPAGRRGTVLGIMSSAGAFGAVLNGLAVPRLLQAVGWQGTWIVAGVLTLATVVVGVIALRRMGIRLGPQHAAPSAASAPHIGLRAALPPQVILIWLTICIGSAVCLPYQTYLSAFLRDGLGASVDFAGSVWMLLGVVGTVGGGLLGALADRIGAPRTLALTALLVGTAALLVWLDPGRPGLLLSGALFGLSYYAIFGLVPTYIGNTVPKEQATSVFSIANVMVGIGGAAGNLLGGWSQAITGGLGAVYLGCAIGAALLFAVVLLLPPERTTSEP